MIHTCLVTDARSHLLYVSERLYEIGAKGQFQMLHDVEDGSQVLVNLAHVAYAYEEEYEEKAVEE